MEKTEIVVRAKPLQSLNKVLDILTNILMIISGTLIFLMSLVTAYSVARRYVFHSPDDTAYLLVCIMMLGCVIFSLANIQWKKQNITVDFFSQRLPRIGREILANIIGPILGLIFCVTIVWKSWDNAWFAFKTNQETLTTLTIPTYPLQMAIPVTVGLLCLVLVVQMLSYLVTLGNRSEAKKL